MQLQICSENFKTQSKFSSSVLCYNLFIKRIIAELMRNGGILHDQ